MRFLYNRLTFIVHIIDDNLAHVSTLSGEQLSL